MPQRRRRKRLGSSTTPPPPKADAPNRVWAVDFQFDATTNGRPIKLVSIIDDTPANACPTSSTRSVTADTLIDELDRLVAGPRELIHGRESRSSVGAGGSVAAGAW